MKQVYLAMASNCDICRNPFALFQCENTDCAINIVCGSCVIECVIDDCSICEMSNACLNCGCSYCPDHDRCPLDYINNTPPQLYQVPIHLEDFDNEKKCSKC